MILSARLSVFLLVGVLLHFVGGCTAYRPAPLEPQHTVIRELTREVYAVGFEPYDQDQVLAAEELDRYIALRREIWLRAVEQHPVSFGPVEPDAAEESSRMIRIVCHRYPDRADAFAGLPAAVEPLVHDRGPNRTVHRAWIEAWGDMVLALGDIEAAERVLRTPGNARLVIAIREDDAMQQRFDELLREGDQDELADLFAPDPLASAATGFAEGTIRTVGTMIYAPIYFLLGAPTP